MRAIHNTLAVQNSASSPCSSHPGRHSIDWNSCYNASTGPAINSYWPCCWPGQYCCVYTEGARSVTLSFGVVVFQVVFLHHVGTPERSRKTIELTCTGLLKIKKMSYPHRSGHLILGNRYGKICHSFTSIVLSLHQPGRTKSGRCQFSGLSVSRQWPPPPHPWTCGLMFNKRPGPE